MVKEHFLKQQQEVHGKIVLAVAARTLGGYLEHPIEWD